MTLLAGKVVCITGSSRGIGRACATECAKQGAKGLVLHYLGDAVTEAEARSLKEDIETSYAPTQAVAVPGDISDPATSSKVRTLLYLPQGAHLCHFDR
jgi:L-rhamnose 1-dehydrogenase